MNSEILTSTVLPFLRATRWKSNHSRMIGAEKLGKIAELIDALACVRTCVMLRLAKHNELVLRGQNSDKFLSNMVISDEMMEYWKNKVNWNEIHLSVSKAIRIIDCWDRWVPNDEAYKNLTYIQSFCHDAEEVWNPKPKKGKMIGAFEFKNFRPDMGN